MTEPSPPSAVTDIPAHRWVHWESLGWDGPRGLDAHNTRGHPLVLWALNRHLNHPRLLEDVLSAGASPNAVSDKGETALIRASGDYPDCVPVLLAYQAHVHQEGRGSQFWTNPLSAAISYGNVVAVLALLEAGADPFAVVQDESVTEDKRLCAVDCAFFKIRQQSMILDILAAHFGADSTWCNQPDVRGITPWMSLCNGANAGSIKALSVLRAAGADPHARDAEGWNCLCYVTGKDGLALFQWLVEEVGVEVDTTFVDANGRSLFDHACRVEGLQPWLQERQSARSHQTLADAVQETSAHPRSRLRL